MSTLQHLKPPAILASLIEQSIDGVTTIRSNSLLLHLDNDESAFQAFLKLCDTPELLNNQIIGILSAIVESLHQNREMILQDKSISWLSNIPDSELSKTSDQDSTSRGKDFYPFWNKSREESYAKLLLPLKIDLSDSDLTSFNGFLKSTMLNSWFSHQLTSHPNKNLPKTCLPSCRSLIVESMDDADTNLIRCRKIKLKLSSEAKRTLERFASLHRYCYNKTLSYVKDSGVTNRNDLRNLVKSDIQQLYSPWVLELPTELREGAAFDVATAMKSCFSNKKAGNIENFNVRFRSRKQKKWTLSGFQKRSFKRISDTTFMLLPTYLPFLMESYETLPDVMEHDFKVHFNGFDYFLLAPYTVERTDPSNRHITALDSGVRAFQTFYHDNGDSGKLCYGKDVARLFSIALQIDRLISCKAQGSYAKTKPEGKKSRRKFKNHVQRQIDVRRKKLKMLQQEMHNKVANYLVRSSKVIICPEFKVKEMCKKFKRKINSKTVRNMSLLAHATFRETLKSKALESSCQVILASEHYTTKTCGNCGTIRNVGSSKIYVCKSCNVILDRDVNGARNVMLRAMRGSAVSCNEMNLISQYRDELLAYHCRQHR